jgi:hypothetical protein
VPAKTPLDEWNNDMVAVKQMIRLGLLGMLATSMPALSAPMHHTVLKAGATDKVSAWLKQCDTDELQCENRLLKVQFKTDCIPEDDVDSYVLTPKVRDWFKAHPAHNSDAIDNGIKAALADLYPCPK